MVTVDTTGSGPPLVLLHGLGGSVATWDPVLPSLAARHTCLRVTFPGHRGAADWPGGHDPHYYADAVQDWLRKEGLTETPVAGFSLGGQVALELGRRGTVGPVTAISPSGFAETAAERAYLFASLGRAVALLRAIAPSVPALCGTAAGRALLLAQIAARPWEVPADTATAEMRDYLACAAFDALVWSTCFGPSQPGADGPTPPVTLIWGVTDLLCPPIQAQRVLAAFPAARLHPLASCGHYALWDRPDEVARLILDAAAAADPLRRAA